MGLFAAAILLSFSRAAWGQVVFTCLIVLLLTFVTSHSPAQRFIAANRAYVLRSGALQAGAKQQ